MELTEDMLKRIAIDIADLRVRLNLVQQVLNQLGVNSQEFDQVVKQTAEKPEFRRFCGDIFEQLKGGH